MDREFFNSTVSWGAIAAGAVVACAVSLLLSAFGVGGGLALVSPWFGEGASATTMSWAAGVALICLAVIASALGGYITGRLRPGWDDVHVDERYFRDTAHGFVTWAFATVLTASLLSAAGTHIVAGAASGSIAATGAGAAQLASSNDVNVDRLLRSTNSTQNGDSADVRAELARLIGPASRKNGLVPPEDQAYAAQLISARTGIPQDEAQKRVNQTIIRAKDAADKARKAAMKLAFWTAASLLAGALAAAFAAAEGGKLRNMRYGTTAPRP